MPPEGNAGAAPATGMLDDPGTPATGGAPAGGTPAAGAGAPAGAAAAGAPVFRELIPQEYREAGWLKNVNDMPTLLKNYENAQKMIGAEKIPVPGPNAAPEEIRAVLARIGLPEKLEEYKVGFDKKYDKVVDPEFVKTFSKFGHEAGLLPAQASRVVDWLAEQNVASEKARTDALEAQTIENINSVKQEWGSAYDQNIARAKAAVKAFGGEETLKFLRESGLGNVPQLVKLLAKAGETLSEDAIRGEGAGGGDPRFTPQQAREQLDEIKKDMQHPYYHANHAGHAAARKKVADLYAAAFPSRTV